MRLFSGTLPWLLFSLAIAQESGNGITALLPPGAKIIETADISRTVGKPRTLVLWMMRPVRRNTGEEYCGTAVHGVYDWEGPARLSLIDSGSAKLISTIKIQSGYLGRVPGHPDDFFLLPSVSKDGSYYAIPHPGKDGTGIPLILNLRDYTGNGVAAEFPVFEYEACGIVDTSLLGYQPKTDTVVQYRFDSGGFWVLQVFARASMRPGYWKFTWRPAHGSDDIVDVDLSFDKQRQIFVDKTTVRQPAH
jgi:hypothetical protein